MFNKNIIIAFILGGIIFGIIGVYAGTVTSSNVSYGSTSVEGALNDLYSKASYGNAGASHILFGQTALVGGKKVTGSMTNYGREPQAGGLIEWSSNLYMYVPDVNTGTNGVSSGEESGYITRGLYTPLSNLGNASQSQVLSGVSFTSSAGLTKTGTMANWTGTPQHIDAVRLANGRFEVAVARGFHNYSWAENSYEYLTYSQVANTIGLTANKIMPGNTILGVSSSVADRGLAQYGNWGCGSDGCGSGNDAYYAINSLPEGYYHSDGNSWAPEARINANTLRSVLGVSSNKIAVGQSIAGVWGSYPSSSSAQYSEDIGTTGAYVAKDYGVSPGVYIITVYPTSWQGNLNANTVIRNDVTRASELWYWKTSDLRIQVSIMKVTSDTSIRINVGHSTSGYVSAKINFAKLY